MPCIGLDSHCYTRKGHWEVGSSQWRSFMRKTVDFSAQISGDHDLTRQFFLSLVKDVIMTCVHDVKV
jgi:hypothetical protein